MGFRRKAKRFLKKHAVNIVVSAALGGVVGAIAGPSISAGAASGVMMSCTHPNSIAVGIRTTPPTTQDVAQSVSRYVRERILAHEPKTYFEVQESLADAVCTVATSAPHFKILKERPTLITATTEEFHILLGDSLSREDKEWITSLYFDNMDEEAKAHTVCFWKHFIGFVKEWISAHNRGQMIEFIKQAWHAKYERSKEKLITTLEFAQRAGMSQVLVVSICRMPLLSIVAVWWFCLCH